MNINTNNIQSMLPDYLKNLSVNIKKRHQEMLSIVNYNIVILFWNIGIEYNRYFKELTENEEIKSIIKAISSYLTTEYGSFFSENEMKTMGKFASHVVDFQLSMEIASSISWQHISHLSSLTDPKAWQFYATLIVEQSLSEANLLEKIDEGLFYQVKSFDKNNVDVKIKRENKLPLWALSAQNRDYSVIGNFFREPLLSGFRSLMEKKQQGNKLKGDMSIMEVNFLESVHVHISKFQKDTSQRLNAEFNKFIWEIGSYINSLDKLNSNDSGYVIFIQGVVEYLEKHFGNFFSKENLIMMINCATHFKENIIFTRIGYLVTWQHIVMLMSLKEIEAKLFYARLAASKGLNVCELENEIKNEIYEKTLGSKSSEQATIFLLNTPTIKKSSKRTGNNIVEINESFIDFGGDINDTEAVNNIFDNYDFFNFMYSHQ